MHLPSNRANRVAEAHVHNVYSKACEHTWYVAFAVTGEIYVECV